MPNLQVHPLMAAINDIPRLLLNHGWMVLDENGSRRQTFFRRLPDTVREELCVIFDKAGKVEAWTIWHNKRITSPDQDAGNRGRLTAFIEGQP